MRLAFVTTLLLLSLLPSMSCAENFVYISDSPDNRYSANGRDTKIVLNLETSGYSYGHDLGNLQACAPEAQNCIAFDFMAVSALPPDTVTGFRFTRGEFAFEVENQTHFTLLGLDQVALRVTVKKQGKLANSFYYSPTNGVIAIGILNFGTPNIPESLFFASSKQGVFHASMPP